MLLKLVFAFNLGAKVQRNNVIFDKPKIRKQSQWQSQLQ